MATPAQIRAQNDPNAEKIGIFNTKTLNKGAEAIGNLGNSLFASTQEVASRSAITYSKAYEKIIQPTSQSLTNVSSGIDGLSDSLTNTLDKYSEQIRTNLQPISDYMGSTLGTLTGVIKDPLGPEGLGNVATKLLNSVSPGLGDKINAQNKALNLEAIARFPKQVMASVDHLISAIDNLLAVPLSIISEIYYGYMAIMQSLSRLVDNIINGFTKFILDFLDSIIPIKSILELLTAISDLANQVGGIATTFMGANAITGAMNQLTQFTSQIGNVLNNPLDLIFAQVPTEVNSFINSLQNPQDFINDLLPPQLSQSFATISKMTGFGFNGNMGFGFQSVLEGFKGGVVRSILTQYSTQYKILAPLLAGQPEIAKGYTPRLIGTFNDALYSEKARPTNNQYTET
jgi:phage-related protein